ncbi:putative zinc-binding metallopeptidase [Chitinophaga sp. Cy-1792]|uniref:putative zinc-binding metallopeptidase n=1 Tax=Chitinophaga sp. Cy-1792 TaxID=2608339 RepID=UPI00141E4FCC|nr:putative zinc-binding metallopeptidase [Chitinophaga sp. Cy-1792]
MKKYLKLSIIAAVIGITFSSCYKDKQPVINDTIDYFPIGKPQNALDTIILQLRNTYGVTVVYKFDPRVIDPTTFFVPALYKKVLPYTRNVVQHMWLEPIAKFAPAFGKNELPIEYLTIGSGVHFNSINSGLAAGAGLNGQYYRLGMGDVDSYDFDLDWIRDHICTVYHEHAHQLDHKYGRPKGYDQVSQGTYYNLEFQSHTDAQALKDGFFTAYGGYMPEEDFATTVESMIRYPKATVLAMAAQNPRLMKKYKMIYDFYTSKGIDLHAMETKLDSVINTLHP